MFIFFLRMYNMVDISAEAWNKDEVSVIKIHENDKVIKTVLLLFCISDTKKKMRGEGGVKIFMT